MLSYETLRAVFRIPWARENRVAIRTLADTFDLLLALYRRHRIQDFQCAVRIYLEMAHSFAQYGREEAKDTVDRLLEIPWFADHHRDLLRLISAYNRAATAFGLLRGDAVRQEVFAAEGAEFGTNRGSPRTIGLPPAKKIAGSAARLAAGPSAKAAASPAFPADPFAARAAVEEFVDAMKALLDFDERDEARIEALVATGDLSSRRLLALLTGVE